MKRSWRWRCTEYSATWRATAKQYIPDTLIQLRRKLLFGRPLSRWGESRRLRQLRLRQVQSLSMSQAGQDFWVYGEVFNEKRDGYFVDVGAHDGVRFSNTFLLEKRYGWRGLCIEANDGTFEWLRRNRSATCINVCVDSASRAVEFVEASVGGGIVAPDCDNKTSSGEQIKRKQTQALQSVLIDAGAPHIIDYLSIDIEGAEDRALLHFPLDQYRFNCITIERPSIALRNRLQREGYRLIKEIPGLDCFYIHDTYVANYFENLIAFNERVLAYRPWTSGN